MVGRWGLQRKPPNLTWTTPSWKYLTRQWTSFRKRASNLLTKCHASMNVIFLVTFNFLCNPLLLGKINTEGGLQQYMLEGIAGEVSRHTHYNHEICNDILFKAKIEFTKNTGTAILNSISLFSYRIERKSSWHLSPTIKFNLPAWGQNDMCIE